MLRLLNPQALRPPRAPTLPTARPQTHFLSRHGEYIAFDANSLAAAQMDADSWNAARDDLAPFKGLLGSDRQPQFHPPARPRIRRLVLNLTHACNLACAYCFARDYDDARTMSPETARRALELFAESDPAHQGEKPPLLVSFFGGEPLLAWDTLVAAVAAGEARAREQNRAARFHVTTNATRLTAERARFLAARGVSLLVSLDGPEELHNRSRPTRDPTRNSWADTMHALELLRQCGGARPSVRATFDAASPRLRERLEFLAALLDRGLIAGFSVEPAVLAESCAAAPQTEIEQTAARLESEYHAAAEWFLSRVKAGKPTGFFHFRKLLQRLYRAEPSGSECGAGNGYVAVGPDGELFACHRETGTRIGRLDYGFDEALRARWSDNRIYCRSGCMDCWRRHVCGGGCRQRAAERGLPLSQPDPAGCLVMRVMVEECLWIMTQLPEAKGMEVMP